MVIFLIIEELSLSEFLRDYVTKGSRGRGNRVRLPGAVLARHPLKEDHLESWPG